MDSPNLNMKNLSVLAACFSIILFFSCRNEEANDQDVILKKLGKQIKNRVFHENVVTEIMKFTYEGRASLVSANSDSVWLIDNYLNKVTVLDENLIFKNSFLDKGEGPKEHVGLKRVFFEGESSYSTFDFSQQLFRTFDFADSMVIFDKFEPEKWVNDIVQLKEDVYLISEAFEDDYKFKIINFKERIVIIEYDILNLLEDVLSIPDIKSIAYDKNLIFEGYFSSGSGDFIVYTFNKAGFFILFNKNGEYVGIFQTIDKLPLPKFSTREISPGYLVHEVVPDLRGNFSRGINEKNVFILSNILEPSYKNKRPIDIYDIKDGKYLYSFFVPNLEDGQTPNEIFVYNDNLYVLYENSDVVKYKLNTLM